jgi:adenylate cyclase class 2
MKLINKLNMGHNISSIEIEDRFWVVDLSPLKNWLKKNATFKFANRQVDEYFTPAHKDYLANKYPNEFFRIRNEEGRFSTTYKFWYAVDNNGHHSHCDEFETEIANGDQFKKMMMAMGFTPRITVDKTRSSYSYKNFEIDIDEVKDLGSYCEIEIEGEYQDIDDAHKQIAEFAKKLGVTGIEGGPDMTGGYAMMIARAQKIL